MSDINVEGNEYLKRILSRGTKYTPIVGYNRDTVQNTYNTTVSEFIEFKNK